MIQNLVSLSLFFACGFAVALGAAWLIARTLEQAKARLMPEQNAILRIRAASGFYRSRIVSTSRSIWTISAPLQRDSYVPMRVGEELVVEVAAKGGVLIGRTKITARDSENHCLLLTAPSKMHKVERRSHHRWPELGGSTVRMSGRAAALVDISEGGARISGVSGTHKGDRVRLDLPWAGDVYAWVVEVEGETARLRFEELVDRKALATG